LEVGTRCRSSFFICHSYFFVRRSDVTDVTAPTNNQESAAGRDASNTFTVNKDDADFDQMASSDLDYNVDDAASYTDHDREAASDAGSPESSPVQKRSCPDNEAATLTFMDTHKLLDTIRSTTDVLECIPPGSKNNVCFVTRLRTDDHSGQAVYADDCGVWNAKSSTTICTTYAVVSGRLVYVTLHNGKYCTGGRKGVWIPLQPQPSPTNIVRAHRHYATLKADTSYRKRVTWF